MGTRKYQVFGMVFSSIKQRSLLNSELPESQSELADSL